MHGLVKAVPSGDSVLVMGSTNQVSRRRRRRRPEPRRKGRTPTDDPIGHCGTTSRQGWSPVGFPSPPRSPRAARPAIPVSPRSTDAMNRRSVSQAGPPPEKTITLASLIAPRLVRRVAHQTSYKSIASHRTTFFLGGPGRVVGWERKKKSHRQRGSGRPASARAAAGEEGRRRAGSRVSELASLRGTPILILGVAHLREAFPSRESTILEAPDPCQRSGSGLFGSPRRVFDEFLSVFGEPNL